MMPAPSGALLGNRTLPSAVTIQAPYVPPPTPPPSPSPAPGGTYGYYRFTDGAGIIEGLANSESEARAAFGVPPSWSLLKFTPI